MGLRCCKARSGHLRAPPGGAGEREKVPASPEGLLLMASSQRDMEDWVQAIRRVIWAPFGGGVFGQRLEDTVHHERKFGPRLAPLLVEQCVDFIRARGLSEEGLFRLPGQATLVRDLQDAFDCGEKPRFDRFLDEVQSHSDVNKMSVQNLATVFGPNILRPQIEDPVTIMEGTSLVQHLMTVLIRSHSQLFSGRVPEGPAAPHAGPPCTVGWGSEEAPGDSQAEPGGPRLPSLRTSSLDGAAVAALSRSSPRGRGGRPAARGTGKRLQTLPGWKAFRPSGSRSGSSSPEAPTASSGGNWLVNGLSSLRGHRRASSGDRLQDGAAQRLSTYDNVPAPSPGPGPSECSLAWSGGSSCGASSGGSVSSCSACRASDSACSSLHPEGTPEPSPAPSSSEELRSPDPGRSLEEAAVCLSSSEPSEPCSPARAPAPPSAALQGLVAELRAELCRQRTQHELSVRRLEDGTTELRERMLRLEEELDQERKKYTMLQIRLRNSERAREDAERRNRLLQEEMEEFFSTLGNLTAGARGAPP
uniref:Rho GTPase activating protein 22 n=1 Tax=Pipistrellus kuhlii TaxID=59472 RepID=A0A7J7T098_PIPKU|nr:Rho GTPase activating protein 22 [Pipistrellus kuhlii]